MDNMFIKAKNAPNNIKICMSTKNGGYSEDAFSSLNLGFFTGDNIYNVIKNYELYKKASNTNILVSLNQVHKTDIIEVTKDNYIDCMFKEADGLFSLEKNIGLGIVTADCLPIILIGEKAIAALHCGWRSLSGGIIDNAFKLFQKYADKVEYAFIGAGLCPKCYEIKDDMASILNQNYKPLKALEDKGSGIYKFNLKQFAVNALNYNNLYDNIEVLDLSTCCSNMFFSYRRDNGLTGRMITLVERLK